MFPKLDRYQKEAYWNLMKIASQHGGAFLCDGVGLGKTFVGLLLIERLILHDRKNVVLFAPKATKEGVWEPHLREWLPHVGGVGGNADFSNLAVFSHTDLGRRGDFPERFRRIAEHADVVVIDEAHHFRNPGRRGVDGKTEPSRYYQLYDLLDNSVRQKTLFLLTATPHQQPTERLSRIWPNSSLGGTRRISAGPGCEQPTRAFQQYGEGASASGGTRKSPTQRS